MTADHDSNTSESMDEASDFEDQSFGDMTQGERVAKALARAGVASRREVERYIEDGRVSLNGVVLTTPAVKVAPGDILKVDGKVVQDAEATRVWRYHKPNGLMTTHNDPKGRPTVFENLPAGLPRVISIGRLDLNSEGLLLLTNDGELARSLELPASGLKRRYRARARGHTTQAKLDALKDGMTVDGVNYGPIEAVLDKSKEGGGTFGANLWITVTLSEGKNREVRRVLEALGLIVNRLIRLAYGPFSLGDLAPGDVEEVGPRVIREQLADHISADKMPTGNAVQHLATSGGDRRLTVSRRDPQAKADEPKKVYKTGWATPKIKPRPAVKPGGSKRPDKPWTPTPASPPQAPTTRAEVPDKPWTRSAASTSRAPALHFSPKTGASERPERPAFDKSRTRSSAPTTRTSDARGPARTDDAKRGDRPTTDKVWTPPSRTSQTRAPSSEHAGRPASKPWASTSSRTSEARGPRSGGAKPIDKQWTTTPPTSAERSAAKKPWVAGPGRTERTADTRTTDKTAAPKPTGRPTSERNWTRAGTREAQATGGKPSSRADGDVKASGGKWGDKPAFDKPPRSPGKPAASRGPVKWAGDKTGDFKRPDRPMYGKPRAPAAPAPSNPTPWAPRKPDDAKSSDRTSSDKPRTSKPRAPGKPSSFGGKPRPKGPAR